MYYIKIAFFDIKYYLINILRILRNVLFQVLIVYSKNYFFYLKICNWTLKILRKKIYSKKSQINHWEW